MVLNLCLFSAILLGILYLFFGAFRLVFATNHDFDLDQVGLSFLGMLIGMFFAIATDHWRVYPILNSINEYLELTLVCSDSGGIKTMHVSLKNVGKKVGSRIHQNLDCRLPSLGLHW